MEHLATTHAATVSPPDIEAYLVDGGLNLLAAILILGVGWWLAKRLSRWTKTALDRVHHFDETLKPLIASLVRYAVLAASVIAVLERFGVETTSLITLLGAAGLAIGLALQGTLSNVASGVMLLVLRPFKVGDWITITTVNQAGSVREIGLFTTILISADQSYVSLPNATIFGSAIVNASREPLSRLNFTVSVDAENDIDAALKIVGDILASDNRILKVPPPMTAVAALKEYSVELLVRCWVHNTDGEAVTFALQKAIRDRFRGAGIAVPARRQMASPTPFAADENVVRAAKPAMRKSG
jgi:small conductance mechanosensitive channel